MGYYTKHNLSIIDGDEQETNDFWEKLDDHSSYPYDQVYYAVGSDGGGSDSCKWYEHKGHMIDVSQEFPSILFLLEGEGEEFGDIWREYYKNGKTQRCDAVITFEEFNEAKMR